MRGPYFFNMSKARKLDQFYTNNKIIPGLHKVLIEKLKDKYDFTEVTWLEPSAGAGSFLHELKYIYKENFKYIAFDIDPKSEFNIKKKDFLTVEKKHINFERDNLITFGNPPFGRKGKLAIEFINKAFEFSDVIALILPNTFVRHLTQKNLDENLSLIHQSEIERDSFTVEDRPYNVNCVFQIWVNNGDKNLSKFKNLRKISPPQRTHDDFELRIHNNTKDTLKYFDKNNFDWDFAIHRQGYYDYSEVYTEEKDLITNRQYLFIKFNNKKYKSLIKKMDLQSLTKWSTSVPGFSNEDFVREYKKIKGKE